MLIMVMQEYHHRLLLTHHPLLHLTIRDTLAGSSKLCIWYKLIKDVNLFQYTQVQKVYIHLYRHNHAYKKALLNGMGYSSRSEQKPLAKKL